MVLLVLVAHLPLGFYQLLYDLQRILKSTLLQKDKQMLFSFPLSLRKLHESSKQDFSQGQLLQGTETFKHRFPNAAVPESHCQKPDSGASSAGSFQGTSPMP